MKPPPGSYTDSFKLRRNWKPSNTARILATATPGRYRSSSTGTETIDIARPKSACRAESRSPIMLARQYSPSQDIASLNLPSYDKKYVDSRSLVGGGSDTLNWRRAALTRPLQDSPGREPSTDTLPHPLRAIQSGLRISLYCGIRNNSGTTNGSLDKARFNGPNGSLVLPDGYVFAESTAEEKEGEVSWDSSGCIHSFLWSPQRYHYFRVYQQLSSFN